MKKFYQLHKWVGVLAGIQLLFWTISGAYFVWFHIDTVKGKDQVRKDKVKPARVSIASLDRVVSGSEIKQVQSVEIKVIAGKNYLVLEGNGTRERYHAETGEKAFPLTESEAKRTAIEDFSGDYTKITAEYLTESVSTEYRSRFPVYKFTFDNWRETSLYVDALTGELRTRRNALWRWYDFFWMLHIMDYDEREDFNNVLAKLFSALGLLTAVTGLGLFASIEVRKRRKKKKQKKPRAANILD